MPGGSTSKITKYNFIAKCSDSEQIVYQIKNK